MSGTLTGAGPSEPTVAASLPASVFTDTANVAGPIWENAVTVQSPMNGAAWAGAAGAAAVCGADARPRTPPGSSANPSAPAETTRRRTNPEYTRPLMGRPSINR